MLCNLEKKVRDVAKKENFKIDKKIHEAYYYEKSKPRVLIFSGTYKNCNAVLKIYNDPRILSEAKSSEIFCKSNKSKILISPRVLKYKQETPKSGWLISKKISISAKQMKSPLSSDERKEFVKLYLEYRKNLPKNPKVKKTLAESLPSEKFHIFRINRWFELANNKEIKRKKEIIDIKKFIPLYERSVDFIAKEFKGVKMYWCNGLFRPKAIWKDNDKYYLLDFSLAHFRPESYELAMIIWADWMMDCSKNWNWTYKKWKKGIENWLQDMRPALKKYKIKNSLMRVALMERTIGSILADITASDRPRVEQLKRNNLFYKLLDDLLKNKY